MTKGHNAKDFVKGVEKRQNALQMLRSARERYRDLYSESFYIDKSTPPKKVVTSRNLRGSYDFQNGLIGSRGSARSVNFPKLSGSANATADFIGHVSTNSGKYSSISEKDLKNAGNLLFDAKKLIEEGLKTNDSGKFIYGLRAYEALDPAYIIGNRGGSDKLYKSIKLMSEGLDKSQREGFDRGLAQVIGMAEKDLQTRVASIGKGNVLYGTATATVALVGILGGAFFYSTKITGNVVGVSTQTSSLIGVGLLIVGLVAGFAWVKNKK